MSTCQIPPTVHALPPDAETSRILHHLPGGECPCCAALFQELSGDPVVDILGPIESRTPTMARYNIRRHLARTDGDRGHLLAVVSRAKLALGDGVGADRDLVQALAAGSQEAAALATIVLPDGERWGLARTAAGSAGARADAWCDLALRAARLGALDEARDALTAAARVCPGHGEAARWLRFLDTAGPLVAALLQGADEPLAAGPARLAQLDEDTIQICRGDAAWLTPRRSLGLLSYERVLRRYHRFQKVMPAPEGSSLAALREQGRVLRYLGSDRDHAAVQSHHPLHLADGLLDGLVTLEREGRSLLAGGLAALPLLDQLPAELLPEVALALTVAATQSPPLLPLVQRALEPLGRSGDPLLLACLARLFAETGQATRALSLARQSRRSHRRTERSWQLCMEALASAGAEDEALRCAARSLHHPVVGFTAQLVHEFGVRSGALWYYIEDRLEDRYPHVDSPGALRAGAQSPM